MPSGTGIAPPRCHPPPDGGTLRHVNNSLPGPVSEGSVHGNGSRQTDNWLLALAEPFVTVLAHGTGVYDQRPVRFADRTICGGVYRSVSLNDELPNLPPNSYGTLAKRKREKVVLDFLKLCNDKCADRNYRV